MADLFSSDGTFLGKSISFSLGREDHTFITQNKGCIHQGLKIPNIFAFSSLFLKLFVQPGYVSKCPTSYFSLLFWTLRYKGHFHCFFAYLFVPFLSRKKSYSFQTELKCTELRAPFVIVDTLLFLNFFLVLVPIP